MAYHTVVNLLNGTLYHCRSIEWYLAGVRGQSNRHAGSENRNKDGTSTVLGTSDLAIRHEFETWIKLYGKQ